MPVAADASAPAQRVVVTQQLDSDLDWRTFRVDDFGFGDQLIEVTDGDEVGYGIIEYGVGTGYAKYTTVQAHPPI